ncbi:MAG: hypothetical protein B6D41_00765 [Chloroflexi bacterium UTCFX4]|jgi:hypothetical protein|nr:MAG: hypothetical protein B6D41_00765 [Chloroflexi bacterium UTCFX4]
MSQRITLQRIDLRTALKFGFVLGAMLALIGATFLLLFYLWALSILRSNPLFAPSPFNPQPVLPLPEIGSVLLWLLVYVLFAAVVYALVVWLYTVIYNAVASVSGGLVFHVQGIQAPSNAPLPMPTPAPSASSFNPFPAPTNVVPDQMLMHSAPMPSMPAPTFQAAPNVQAGVWLIGVSNPLLRVELSRSVTRVGSAMGNDLVIPSPRVAAYHAEIRIENGRYILHDVSNGMGVMVNQRQVQGSNMLKNNFQVTLGDTTFVFQQ